jgi:hypothetical protein
MIPESQHNDAMASQEFLPRLIPNLAHTEVMPTAIQFDSQLCARTIEIQHVVIEWMLASKFVACKISIPQVSPKNPFRLRRLLSQQSSAINNVLVLITA